MVRAIKDDEEAFLKCLIVWQADIQTGLSAITFLHEEEDREKYNKIALRRLKCFETAFVVAYNRPFVESRGGRKLSLKRINVQLTKDEEALHAKLLLLRNKIYAHTDMDYAHVRLDVYKFEDDDKIPPLPRVQFDEGLEFHDPMQRIDAMELCHKIFGGIFNTLSRIAANRPEMMPVYLRPDRVE